MGKTCCAYLSGRLQGASDPAARLHSDVLGHFVEVYHAGILTRDEWYLVFARAIARLRSAKEPWVSATGYVMHLLLIMARLQWVPLDIEVWQDDQGRVIRPLDIGTKRLKSL
eukprot:4191028-Amphidinium_carterae.2